MLLLLLLKHCRDVRSILSLLLLLIAVCVSCTAPTWQRGVDGWRRQRRPSVRGKPSPAPVSYATYVVHSFVFVLSNIVGIVIKGGGTHFNGHAASISSITFVAFVPAVSVKYFSCVLNSSWIDILDFAYPSHPSRLQFSIFQYRACVLVP